NETTSKESLLHILELLQAQDVWTLDALHEKLMALVSTLGVKNGLLLYPLRVALSGKQFTPGGGIELAAVMGKEKTVARVKAALKRL
ncbi:MAG: glutamate--tRNA ligase, partial [Ruthenibacterium sp.]